LQALATISRAPPKRSIRHRNVGYPFPILGEFEVTSRYFTEFGRELTSSYVVVEKFVAALVAIDKQALTVGAGNGKNRRQWAVG
jgi:hypothetical protein